MDHATPAQQSLSEEVIEAVVTRVTAAHDWSEATLRTAALCLIDSVACALGSLETDAIDRLLGPFVPGTVTPHGARVPGTTHVLDPVKAAFDTATLIRWLDFSDTSVVGGHPSDNIGAILAVADHVSRRRAAEGEPPLTMRTVLEAMIDAYEIQGALASVNRFDRPEIGLDHVIYVKIASAAVSCRLMGGTAKEIRAALSNSWLDSQSLNAYRHVPNAGARKGWAAGDAASRGVLMAWMAMQGEKGSPLPLSAPTWGFNQVHMKGEPVRIKPGLDSFFMDNVIFKLVPAQRNTSTAIEAAIRLHPWFVEHAARVSRIHITTHDETMRRVVKTGPLPNRAARDHCIQYMVAIALLKGRLTLADYSDEAAADPAVDQLRDLMVVEESAAYTADHHDLAKRTCANALEIETSDGERSPRVEILYPAGDAARRDEALPMLREKFFAMTAHRWPRERQDAVLGMLSDLPRLMERPVHEVMATLAEPAAT